MELPTFGAAPSKHGAISMGTVCNGAVDVIYLRDDGVEQGRSRRNVVPLHCTDCRWRELYVRKLLEQQNQSRRRHLHWRITYSAGTRNQLDLLQVAINPQSGKTAIIYANVTLITDSWSNPLPQGVLAQQK